MSILNPNDERYFAQAATWSATVAATLVTADGLQVKSVSFTGKTNAIQSQVKTGSLGRPVGRRGRRAASFSITVPLKGSGVAGTVSDIDQILGALFGVTTGTVVAATSVTYQIAEATIGLTIGRFRDPSGANVWNQVLHGGLIDAFEISFGGEEEAFLTVSGPAVDVIDKPNFASNPAYGLGAFPTEPSAPTFLGLSALAFVGSITINGVSTFKLASGRIFGTLSRAIRPSFGTYYADVPISSIRTLGVDFTIYEEDTAAQAALRQLGRTVGSCDAIIALGDVAGNINTFTIKNITFSEPDSQESDQESLLSFSATAAATSAVLNDELKLVQT